MNETTHLHKSPSRRRTAFSSPAYRTWGSARPLFATGPVIKTCPTSRITRTIAAAHAALHHDDLLALPRVQHGHARNGATGLERNRVDGVVRANDERHVRLTKVVIYLVHLQHDCEKQKVSARKEERRTGTFTVVGNRCFGEQDVALARHTSCDGVNGEAYIHALCPQQGRDFRYRVLGFCHGHAVPDNL